MSNPYTCFWSQPHTCKVNDGSTCCSLFDTWAEKQFGRRTIESKNYTPDTFKDQAAEELIRSAAWCCLKDGTCGSTRLQCHYPDKAVSVSESTTERTSEVALLVVLILVISVAIVALCVCYWQKKTLKNKLNALSEEREANEVKTKQIDEFHKVFNQSGRVGSDPSRSQRMIIPLNPQAVEALVQLQASQQQIPSVSGARLPSANNEGLSKRTGRKRSTTFLDEPNDRPVDASKAAQSVVLPQVAPDATAAFLPTSDPEELEGHIEPEPYKQEPQPGSEAPAHDSDENITLDMLAPQKVDLDDI